MRGKFALPSCHRAVCRRIARLHITLRETIVTLICKYPAPQGVLERVPAAHTHADIVVYTYICIYRDIYRYTYIGRKLRFVRSRRRERCRCAFASSNTPQWSCDYEGKSGVRGADHSASSATRGHPILPLSLFYVRQY